MDNTFKPFISLDKQCGPEFPVDNLPKVLKDMVKEVCNSYQVPLDLPGTLALISCSAALGKQYRVQITEDWSEPTNLYAAVCMPPASRKSAVYKVMTSPLELAESKYLEENYEKLKENKRLRGIIAKSIKLAEKKASEAIDPLERYEVLERIKELEKEMPEQLFPFRLLADDVTAEKVTNLLSEHHGRLAIMSAEGGIFDILAGRYSNNTPNFEVFLKGHAGDNIQVDRMGRESEKIKSASLVVGLTVQPDVLKTMSEQKGFRGRGLIGRFLMVIPPDNVGNRKTKTAAVLPRISAEYSNMLLGLTTDLQKFEDNSQSSSKKLCFNDETKILFQQFQEWAEHQLRPGGSLDGINDWGGKLAGAVARIAGILHVVKFRNLAVNEKIDQETFQAALSLGHYFIGHAHVAFNLMVGNDLHKKALKIVKWMQLNNKNKETARNIQQALRSTFRKMENMWPVLNLLCEHGYLSIEKQDQQNSPGRYSSPIYILRTNLCTHITQNTHNAA